MFYPPTLNRDHERLTKHTKKKKKSECEKLKKRGKKNSLKKARKLKNKGR